MSAPTPPQPTPEPKRRTIRKVTVGVGVGERVGVGVWRQKKAPMRSGKRYSKKKNRVAGNPIAKAY